MKKSAELTFLARSRSERLNENRAFMNTDELRLSSDQRWDSVRI